MLSAKKFTKADMIVYYRVNDFWHTRDSRKVFTTEADTLQKAARTAWKETYPNEKDESTYPELEENSRKVYFGSVEVPKDQETLRIQHKFGDSYHTYRWIDGEIEGRCHCCEEDATQRIEYNCWGSIIQYDVCSEHAERYDGRWGDGIPSFEDLNPTKTQK